MNLLRDSLIVVVLTAWFGIVLGVGLTIQKRLTAWFDSKWPLEK